MPGNDKQGLGGTNLGLPWAPGGNSGGNKGCSNGGKAVSQEQAKQGLGLALPGWIHHLSEPESSAQQVKAGQVGFAWSGH